MSESKYTQGKADAQRWMGGESDPRWTVTLGGAVRFITAGDNDENNAIECKRRWNSHDDLLEACEAFVALDDEKMPPVGHTKMPEEKTCPLCKVMRQTEAAISKAKGE